MELKEALEQVGVQLGLRSPTTIGSQSSTGIVLRFLNDEGKYEQVRVFPETFISRNVPISVATVKEEVARMLEAGESEVLD